MNEKVNKENSVVKRKGETEKKYADASIRFLVDLGFWLRGLVEGNTPLFCMWSKHSTQIKKKKKKKKNGYCERRLNHWLWWEIICSVNLLSNMFEKIWNQDHFHSKVVKEAFMLCFFKIQKL